MFVGRCSHHFTIIFLVLSNLSIEEMHLILDLTAEVTLKTGITESTHQAFCEVAKGCWPNTKTFDLPWILDNL